MAKRSSGEAPLIVVTGAAGGLGVHLVRALLDAGYRVRAYDLQSPEDARRSSLLRDHQAQWTLGPCRDDELDQLFEGAQAVVHAAGLVSLSGSDAQFRAANRDETIRIFESSRRVGIEHFLYISCSFVYQTETMIRTEISPTKAQNAFERSKLAAEGYLKEQADQDPSLSIAILRLGMLYGPGCTTMGAATITILPILREFSRYLPGLTGGPRTNWCHVQDAATAVQVVLENREKGFRLFNVTDEMPLTFGEVLTSIAEAYGIDLGPSVPLPNAALWAILSPLVDNEWAFDQSRRLLTLGWKRIQKLHKIDSPLAPRLNRAALYYLRDESVVVATAMHELGWEPRWRDFREGIKPTLRWYQDEGWAPRFSTEAEVERRDAKPEHHFHHEQRGKGTLSQNGESRGVTLRLDLSWPSFPLPPGRKEAHLSGEITIEGLSGQRPLLGTVELSWFPTINGEYQFGFEDDEGRACRFVGQRKLKPSDSRSWQTLEGLVYDRHGESLGRLNLELEGL